MKFKVGDDVRSVATGQIGEVVGSDYMYKVKNGEVQEMKKYYIRWKDRDVKLMWMHEYQLTHFDENLKTENEYIAELSLLEIQVDQALINGNKEAFEDYAKNKHELLDEMEIRGFVKQRRV